MGLSQGELPAAQLRSSFKTHLRGSIPHEALTSFIYSFIHSLSWALILPGTGHMPNNKVLPTAQKEPSPVLSGWGGGQTGTACVSPSEVSQSDPILI